MNVPIVSSWLSLDQIVWRVSGRYSPIRTHPAGTHMCTPTRITAVPVFWDSQPKLVKPSVLHRKPSSTVSPETATMTTFAMTFEVQYIPCSAKVPDARASAMACSRIRATIAAQPTRHVLVTHGTDSMVQTGRVLKSIPDKTIVMTGALSPARFRGSDAEFNIGCAIGAVQSLQPGVYIAMNGRIWNPEHVRKNVAANRFEDA